MTLDTATQGLSSKIFADVQKQLDPIIQQYAGTYLDQSTPYLLRSAGFSLDSPVPASTRNDIQLIGAQTGQIATHLTLVQGQLPQTASTNGAIDSLLTPATAKLLHVTVGSVISLHGDFFTNPAFMFGGATPTGTVTLRIVGLFNVAPADTSYWHGEDFLPIQRQQADSYTLLVPGEAFLTALDQIAAASHEDTVFSPQTFKLTWYYRLNASHIAVDQVNNLSNRLSQLRTSIANKYSNLENTANGPSYPYLVQVNLFNPAAGFYEIPNTLDQFRNRAAVVTIPIAVITLLVFCLILFFASLVANLLVDASTARRLNLQPGESFAVSANNLPYSNLNCQVLTVVQHIPTVNSSEASGNSGTYVAPGGIMLDYTTFAAVYKQNILAGGSTADPYLPINHVWLNTRSDPASLANVRTALKTPGLRLENLYDRRLLIAEMGSDPLYLSLMIILTIGSLTALLLALVGNLLASWMSVRIRLTSFAVLRALGTTPGQVTRVLLWEQVVIYSTALLLGIIFGAIISATAVSTLAFSSISASGVLSSLSSDEFYVFQRIIPAQIVIPLSLGLAFVALVVICITALGIMAGVTLRPSMSQTLRLNED